MKNNIILTSLIVSAMFIGGCSKKISDKMEYSTSSSTAAGLINTGLRYQDNFAFEQARQTFQQAIDEDPQFAFAYYCLAWITPDRLKRDALVKEGEKYLESANNGERAMLDTMVASLAGADVNWPEWVQNFTQLYPKEIRYLNLLGNFANGDGDIEKAESYYKKSLAIEENPDALNSLAYLYTAQGKMNEAKVVLDRQIAVGGDLANPYDSMGDYYLEVKDNQKAKEYFEKALSNDPEFMMSKRKVWRIEQEEAGNKVEQMEWSSDSANAVSAFKTGVWQFYNIHWVKARENFEEAIKIDPEFAMPYLYLVLTPGDSTRSEEARKIADGLSSSTNSFEKSLIDLNLYRRENPEADLTPKINRLKSQYPTELLVMVQEAGNFFRKDEFEKASNLYTNIWERFDFVPALNMIGYSNMRAGNMTVAKKAFSDYLTNNGDHANPYDSMGEYLDNMEDYDAAYDYYMMAYTVDSTFAVSKERAEEVKKKIQIK
jgi:tetratricopeptide (TPR) repeat protein